MTGPEPADVGDLTQDSRQVQPGSVFIALRGTQVDGHRYIADAVKAGAGVVICEEAPQRLSEEVCIITVENTRMLIGPLAQAVEGHPADSLKVIGVTGTNGKTTVATLVYQVLMQMDISTALLGTVAKMIGSKSLDSRLTTADPIELARDMRAAVDAGITHLVMEVSSHALDQERIKGIDFTVAAFTNLSHDHLDYHKTVENYAAAKKKLFDDLNAEATAVINSDDERGAFMMSDTAARRIAFGFETDVEVPCHILSNTSAGLRIEIDGNTVESPLVGTFNAYNLAEAFLIGRALGFGEDDLAKALAKAPGAEGRMERVGKGRPLVLVDYAHTPDALENVLRTLRAVKTEEQQVHVVFGCGGNRDKTKRPEMAAIAESLAEAVTVTSDNPRHERPEAIIQDIMHGFEHPEKVRQVIDRREAIRQAVSEADKQTIVLIAGKGHETYQEIEGRRYDFDDRAIAREALEQRHPNPENPEVT